MDVVWNALSYQMYTQCIQLKFFDDICAIIQYLFSQLMTRKYDSTRNRDLVCLNMVLLRIYMKSFH